MAGAGAQQQMRAASRYQPTSEAEHRLVLGHTRARAHLLQTIYLLATDLNVQPSSSFSGSWFHGSIDPQSTANNVTVGGRSSSDVI